MKFLSFKTDAGISWGMIADAGVIDLGARMGGSLLETIQAEQLEDTFESAAFLEADHDLEEITFLPPVQAPEKIICIGVNYANRNQEYRDNSALPAYPSVFMRTIDSFAGHRQPLWKPPESEQLDYEGEVGIVIGKEGHRIPEKQALDYIGGLTVMNEGSVRDWMRHGKFNVTPGKNFVKSGSFGPWLVPAVGQFGDYSDLTISTTVNNEQRQHDNTCNLIFSFSCLIHYLSAFFILKPGDIIATGTPPGAGARLDPPKYLMPGDVIEVEVPGVGTLNNDVTEDPTL